MLTYYLTQTQRLLQNPGAPTSLYSTADLTSYINTMRGQLAGDSQCIRGLGTATTTIGTRTIDFSGITISTPALGGVLNVRRVSYGVASGFKWVAPRPMEWFELYSFNNPVPPSGPPQLWSQFQQGSAGIGTITNEGAALIRSGNLILDPIPDLAYVLQIDCAWYPIALVQDSDPEAIPYEWTDAIPFGAAWMALLSAQTSARMAEAQQYFQIYQQYVARARGFSNPDVLKGQYEQQPNITLQNQLGVSLPKGGGQ